MKNDNIDLRDLGTPTYSNTPTGGEGAFRKGLRSGMTHAGGTMQALAGRVAETVGADEFAANRYAASEAAQAQAASEAPELNDWRKIGGLRDLGTYLAGQAGQMAPMLAAGIVGARFMPKTMLGATLNPTVRAISGATAATAPITIGGAVERQQANPEAMKASLLDRNLTALGSGTVEAVATNVVPQALGGKLLGRGVGGAVAKEGGQIAPQASKKMVLGQNLAEGTVGQGLAMGNVEVMHQAEETHFDPNRDKSQDLQRIKDAIVTGAIVGTPFGLAGAAGQLANRQTPAGGSIMSRLKEKAEGALGKDGLDLSGKIDKAKDFATNAAGKEGVDVSGNANKVKDFAEGAYEKTMNVFKGMGESAESIAAKDIAAGRDPVGSLDPDALAQASPEARQAMVDGAETSRMEQVKKMAEELYADQTLSPESKAKLEAMAGDFTSAANQMAVAGMKVAQDGYRKTSDKIGSAYRSVMQQYEAFTSKDGKKKSELGEGIREVVSDTVIPFLQQHRPDILKSSNDVVRIGETLRMVASIASKSSDTDMQGIRYLNSVFGGPALRDILMKIHGAIDGDADPIATKKFMSMISRLQKTEVTTDYLQRVIAKGMDAEKLAQYTKQDPEFMQTMVDGIRSHIDESAYRNMSKERAGILKTDFELAMQKEFGSNAKSILAVFAKEAETNTVRNSRKGGEEDLLNDGEDGAVIDGDIKEGADFSAEFEPPKYYGTGKGESLELMDHPSNHRLKYNSKSPAESRLEKAQKENPDSNVELVRFEDLPPEMQQNYPDGAGKVIVRVENMKFNGRMTSKDLDSVLVDTSKTSHRKSPSRIDTGVNGAVIDARKLVKLYQSEVRTPFNESDDKSAMHRMSRVFMEAIAATQDRLGKSFEVPDNVVVGVNGGKDITWGQLKKLKFAPDTKVSSELTEFLNDATHLEMARALRKVSEEVYQHELKVSERIEQEKELFGYLTREDILQIVDEMETPESAQAKKDEFQIKQAMGPDKETFASKAGKRETGEEANPYEFREDIGAYNEEAFTGGRKKPAPLSEAEQEAVNRTSMDGSPINTGTRSRDKQGGVGTADAKIKERIAKMGKSAVVGMRDMAIKLRELRREETYKTMSKKDRDQLGAEILMAKKASDLNGIVEAMSRKYLGDFTEPSQFGGSKLKKTDALGADAAEGNVKRSNQVPGAGRITPEQQAAVEKMIKGSLGDKVRVEFSNLLHAGDYERVVNKAGLKEDLIRLSIHTLDPMSVGFHETLHGFIQHMREADTHGVNSALYRSANSPYVRAKLREFLKNEPEALKQVEGPNSSVEERAAYMYQMWAAGKLNLREGPRTILEKISDFIKKTLGIWTGAERSENIMQYLRDGEYAKSGLGDRSAVSRALLESGTNKTFETIKETLAPLGRVAHNIVSTGDNVLARMENPAIDKIRHLFNASTDDTGVGTGWIASSRIARTKELNGLMNDLAANNYTAEHMQQAMEQLQSGVVASSPEARLLAGEKGPIRKLLDRMHEYARESGVDIGDRGKGAGYFPVVWDISHISSNQKAFRTMLEKYVRSGQVSNPDALIKRLMTNDGNDFGVHQNTRPGMEHVKERQLDFISKEDRAPFLRKNLMETMGSYVNQIARRAEWSKRFGDKSEKLQALIKEAKETHGATKKEIDTLEDFIQGVSGSLGESIDPNMRRIFGNMTIYQNVRLLPLAVFSMAVDPGGIMIRGGSMGDAFTAFRRGITEVKRGFEKNPSKDEWYEMAELMGVIDNAALVHTLGSSYSHGMVGDTGRKINDTFFKYNLVEQMNTSMRVAAVPAALKFIAKHGDGTNSHHSKRWMQELDLTPDDVVTKDGKLLTTQAELEASGMNTADAIRTEVNIRMAVNKWVDGAVLRPNSAHKPVWMNDPHFALVAHLKQFVYSFNETIIRRVLNEAKYGNYTPAYAVAGYIPTMMAADFIKGMVVNGGSQPEYKENWDLGDYLSSGVQRSGLTSTGQFGIDAYKDMKMGGSGVFSLLGPQIEQIADGIKTLGGQGSGGSFALDSAPASPIVKAISRSGVSTPDPTFNR